MKADSEFSRYSEREWSPTAAYVAKVNPALDLVALRDKLEQYGRDYVAMLRLEDPERRDFFVAKQKLAAEFRQQVIEAGQLPPELRQRALRVLDVVREVERHYQDCAAEFGRQHYGLRTYGIMAGPGFYSVTWLGAGPQNAQLAALDCYFRKLRYEWRRNICDDLVLGRSNTKATRTFIALCARPVAGARSTSERAISERLYRLDRRRRDQDAKFEADRAAAVEHMWQKSPAIKRWPARRTQTKRD